MSRRQALGVLTVNAYTGNSNTANQRKVNDNVFKQSSSGSFKATSSSNQLNRENQAPSAAAFKAATAAAAKSQDSCDFEIFQEEKLTRTLGANVAKSHPLRLRESKHVNFFLENNQEEYEEEEEKNQLREDRDEAPENDEAAYDKENDDETAASDANLDEEGIARLNIAAMIESTSSSLCSRLARHNETSQCDLVMDASSSAQDDEDDRMLLDDTIKCVSMKSAMTTSSSLYIEEEEEEADDEVEQRNKNLSSPEEHDDEDEEAQRRIEATERENILMNFAEYKDEILQYMFVQEQLDRPKSGYMKKQVDINSNMRAILVDWLVEVCEEYKLNAETLYLAVNYTDRFLSLMSVLRGKLQLVGTASMYIAAKYEEIVPPDINEFVYITDDTYTRKQVLRMEHLILKALEFKMSSPTANWFLNYFLRFVKMNTSLSSAQNAELVQRIENLARYLCELSLIDSDTYLVYLPSQIATSALWLAMHTLDQPWTKQCAEICGRSSHELDDLKPCIMDMYKTMQMAHDLPQQAIQEKYKHKKYDYVAQLEPPKCLPPHLFS